MIFHIALGSNLGGDLSTSAATLQSSVDALQAGPGKVVASSRFFRTPAFPAGNGPDYVNAMVMFESDETPEGLLERLHRIEAMHGRERLRRWAPRVLDLDLVAADQVVAPDLETHRYWRELPLDRQQVESPDRLIIPHPRLQDRAFVLVPWAEIAPDWVHPVLRQSVAEMCADLDVDVRQSAVPLSRGSKE